VVVKGSIKHERGTGRSEQNNSEAVSLKCTLGIIGTAWPQETGEISVFVMQLDVQKRLLYVSTDSKLMIAEPDKDSWKQLEERRSCLQTIVQTGQVLSFTAAAVIHYSKGGCYGVLVYPMVWYVMA